MEEGWPVDLMLGTILEKERKKMKNKETWFDIILY
jgi:hypothetical protein